MCTLLSNCASLPAFMPSCAYPSAHVCMCVYLRVCVCVLLLKVHIHPVRPSGGQPLAKCTTERLLCDWSEAASAPLGETLKNASVKKNPISPCNIKSSLSSCSDATESITGSLNDVCRGWAKSTGQNSGRLFCEWLFFFFFFSLPHCFKKNDLAAHPPPSLRSGTAIRRVIWLNVHSDYAIVSMIDSIKPTSCSKSGYKILFIF